MSVAIENGSGNGNGKLQMVNGSGNGNVSSNGKDNGNGNGNGNEWQVPTLYKQHQMKTLTILDFLSIGNHFILHIYQVFILGIYLGGMELSHFSNASIFYLELLKFILDHGQNDLVFVSIFSLELSKVLFDNGIYDLVFVICVPLELPYLGLKLRYLLGLILIFLKKIPCIPEKLCVW